MIVQVNADKTVSLVSPEDMKAFKVVVPPSVDADLAGTLKGVGEFAPPDHVWVSQAWLRQASGLSQSAEWNAGFEKLVAFATSKGWVREDGAIRAHVERPA